MTTLDATFVTSAASAGDVPAACRPQIALVGRSNVGKSSLINALTRTKVARTSAAPGKTRLANVYRIGRTGRQDRGLGTGGSGLPRRSAEGAKAGDSKALFLVDLPGYGYARGGDKSAREFAKLAAEYFDDGPEAALLLVDSRHPGLETDLEAWRWLSRLPIRTAIVATKIDKLGRAERSRAIREMERSFDSPVLPVSAATGEGMETLWKLIAKLASPHPSPETPA